MINEHTQNLAEKIALLLQENQPATATAGGDDVALIQASLEKISQRLDNIESQISTQNSTSHSAFRAPQSFHPSTEKFENLEELADQIISLLPTEKACPYEPTGKPCDHCAMCNSRGF